MFNQWPTRDSSGWWMAGFVFGMTAFLAVTVAGAAGDQALDALMRGSLIGVFVLGGGLLGLLVAHQFCQTHLLSASPEEEQRSGERTASPPARAPSTGRGFRDLLFPERDSDHH